MWIRHFLHLALLAPPLKFWQPFPLLFSLTPPLILRNALDGVDEIWHTGDIAGRCGSLASAEAVLKPLRDIAPVTACVRGNTDAFAGGLLGHRGHSEARASSEYGKAFPEVASIDFLNGGHTAVLTHICAPPKGCDKPSQDALVVRVTEDGDVGDKEPPPVLSVPSHLSGTGSFGSAMAASAARRGVSIVVCGHSHVPGISHHKGVLWINPGDVGVLDVLQLAHHLFRNLHFI